MPWSKSCRSTTNRRSRRNGKPRALGSRPVDRICPGTGEHSRTSGRQRAVRGSRVLAGGGAQNRVEELVHHGQKGGKAIEAAVTNLDRTIAATQLESPWPASAWDGSESRPWRASSSRCSVSFRRLARNGHAYCGLGPGFLPDHLHARGLRRVDPKTLALQKPDGTALWVAAPLNLFRPGRPAPDSRHERHGQHHPAAPCGYPPATGREIVHSIEELSLLIEDTEERNPR